MAAARSPHLGIASATWAALTVGTLGAACGAEAPREQGGSFVSGAASTGTTGSQATSSGAGPSDGSVGSGASDPETGADEETTMSAQRFDVGGTAGTGAPPECGGAVLELDTVAPHVMFVFDRSNSMFTERWDHDGDAVTPHERRWVALHDAAVAVVGDYEAHMHFGAAFFPSLTRDGCGVERQPDVPIDASGMSGDAVVAALPARDSSMGGLGTPSSLGVNAAVDHLQSLDPATPRAIIYITDGRPASGCATEFNGSGNDGNPVVAMRLEAARLDHGVTSYVVGIDISSFDYDSFNDVAVAGGAPQPGSEKFFNAVDHASLAGALASIAGDIQSCDIELDPAPESRERTRVELDGVVLERQQSCEDGDGWAFLDDARIALCGVTCDAFKLAGGTIQARYDCPPAR